MKIHIMGASCAGSTTLGNALSAEWGIPYFDTDDFFWERLVSRELERYGDIIYTDPEQPPFPGILRLGIEIR